MKIIGIGEESVYLYYYPAYKNLAEQDGKKVWACKIGKTKNEVDSRIEKQCRTALPEEPEVGLIIKCDDASVLEKTLHRILRLEGKCLEQAPGNEWFLTSPDEVESIYKTHESDFKNNDIFVKADFSDNSLISYEPFYVTLKVRCITEYALIHNYGIPANTIHRMKHGQAITTKTIGQLCVILNCDVSDIITLNL